MIAKNQAFNVSAGYTLSKYKAAERDPKTNVVLKKAKWGSDVGASYGASTSVMYGTATSVPRLRRNTFSESSAFMTDLYVGFSTAVTTTIGSILESYLHLPNYPVQTVLSISLHTAIYIQENEEAKIDPVLLWTSTAVRF